MARYGGQTSELANAASSLVTGTKIVPAGYMGEFGTGLWQAFLQPGTYSFTVPAGIKKIRVRVLGGGAGGYGTTSTQTARGGGAGGGGFAWKVIDVTPGQTYTVTVGAGGAGGAGGTAGTAGGTSSFGSIFSATGGSPAILKTSAGLALGGVGGIGIGGDFNASGGNGGDCNYMHGTSNMQPGAGGGGAGSQLGNGGRGGDVGTDAYPGAGGGVGGGDARRLSASGTIGAYYGGGSPFGSPGIYTGAPNILGIPTLNSASVFTPNPNSSVIRFPFDGFVGGGGTAAGSVMTAGIGGGGGVGSGSSGNLDGGEGGGGGGSYSTPTSGGKGGRGGGGGSAPSAGAGGDGLVVVEF